MGMGFEYWEVGFGKKLGWEMGFVPPLQAPLKKLSDRLAKHDRICWKTGRP